MKLEDFFNENNKIAIGFSGGADSTYLVYMAKRCNADVTAYYVKTALQPEFELEDAKAFAERWQIPLKVITLEILADKKVKQNTENRCYFCKQHIFSAIVREALADGYTVVADGTNASDDAADRPGMQALKELGVRSPLRECKITKQQIREDLKKAGISLWNKPAYACLATRIATGEDITEEKLVRTEQAEAYMKTLGFADFRVRCKADIAKIQIREEQKTLFDEHRDEIYERLRALYKQVILDTEYRK